MPSVIAPPVARRLERRGWRTLPPGAVITLALLLGGLVRLGFIAFGHLPLDSDEAIVGLMARHILYQGERPIFYYGQNYLGPLEPASAAVLFALMGPSLVALRLAPALYSLLFVYLTVRFADVAFGPLAARSTLAYLAIPPLFLLTWSVKARGGYAELLALGAAVLWLTLDLVGRPEGGDWRWVALGLVAGTLLWTDPLGVVYLGPAVLYLLLHRRGRLWRWTSPAAGLAAVLASLPMLVANVQSHGATLRDLAGPNESSGLHLGAMAANLGAVTTRSLPVLLGFYQASSHRPAFDAAVAALGPGRALALAVTLVVLAALVAAGVASLPRLVAGRPQPGDLLLWVAAATVALFLTSQAEALFVTEPRYLLPLYAAVPLAGQAWAAGWRRSRPLAGVALAVVLAFNLVTVVRFVPALASPYLNGEVVHPDDPGLVAFLAAHGVRALYADYWLGYPIAFQSGERIAPSVIDDRLAVGFNRSIPLASAVAQAPDPAVLVVAGGPAEAALRQRLGVTPFQVARWQNLDLYTHLTPPFRPQ